MYIIKKVLYLLDKLDLTNLLLLLSILIFFFNLKCIKFLWIKNMPVKFEIIYTILFNKKILVVLNLGKTIQT